VVSFPQVSPPKSCTCLSPPSSELHVPPISFFSILSPAQQWVRSIDHAAKSEFTERTQGQSRDYWNLQRLLTSNFITWPSEKKQ
jgi:hypothetical protein